MAGGVVSTGNGSLRMQAVQKSLVVLNLPYVWGGDSLSRGVDCSGLVQQVYKQIGIAMPRQARAQATTGTRVASVNQLQPGDLVAFKWAGGYAGPNTVSHIAIYAGNGEIIEAYGGSHGRRRKLTNSQQDQGAIYIHTRYPGE
jgi:cell wall-associated NlpC family hydrolase